MLQDDFQFRSCDFHFAGTAISSHKNIQSVFLNDVEVAITGFDGSGEHIVDLNPEWNHIKLKTHSPSVIWIWEKDIYYSIYKAIE